MNLQAPNDPNTPWQYKPGDTINPGQSVSAPPPSANDSVPAPQPPTQEGVVSWMAPEYLEHQRGSSWYLALFLATATLTVIVYFMTKEYLSAGTIVMVGLIVAAFARHKPQQVKYELSDSGLGVGDKRYDYGLFKSFTVIREGELSSLELLPLKRLMPPVSAYYTTQDEQRIIDTIGDHLPYEERKLEIVDRLSRRLRL